MATTEQLLSDPKIFEVIKRVDNITVEILKKYGNQITVEVKGNTRSNGKGKGSASDKRYDAVVIETLNQERKKILIWPDHRRKRK
jgi:hypothetical protein